MHEQLKGIRKARAAWTSDKSDCIGLAKLMADYFNFVNADLASSLQRADDFCSAHELNSKVMKEAHFLCLQLQKIVKEDLYEHGSEPTESFDFLADSDFRHPSKQEEEVLQQVLISGLCENLCRIAPVFDSLGNEIVVKIGKGKVTYECQESTGKLQLQKLSALYGKSPAFLVFQEVYSTDVVLDDGSIKTIQTMKNCTQVDNLGWL